MRLLFALVYDLVAFLLALLMAPTRLLARRKPFYVALELKGDPPWRSGARRGWLRLRRGRRGPLVPESLKSLQRTLELAGRDGQVRGVVIRVEDFEGAGIKLVEIGRMLQRLREQGKDVVFYGRAVTMREYALMAGGNRIQLAPGGRLDLKGYSAQTFVLGETLARAGVGAQFLRRSEYKTAPELFTDSAVSEPQKETLKAILEQLFADAVAAIARGRGRSEDEVRAIVDAGPFTAAQARARGLVDAIGDGEDLETLLAREGEEKARLLPVAAYRGPSVLRRPRYRRLRRRPRIALVKIDGVIKLGESVNLPWARAAGSDTVAQALRNAREDESLRAIVLHVNSRGGSSLASELILKAVQRAAAAKPVVAYVDQVAASGGYMALLGATHVMVSPSALTGSIGVFTGKFEVSKLMDRLGVGRAVLRLGRHSGLESTFEPWSEDERATLEREVEEIYREFLRLVAEGRKLGAEQVEPLAGGRVYTGRRAQEVGLVDALGGIEDAVRKASELAGLRREPDLVPVQVPVHTLQALSGPRAWAEAIGELLPSRAERVFALAPWIDLDPRP